MTGTLGQVSEHPEEITTVRHGEIRLGYGATVLLYLGIAVIVAVVCAAAWWLLRR